MPLDKKDILDIAALSTEEIQLILDTAESMREISERPIKKVPTLRGKTVILFFYEPSTRTRLSFDLAAKRLSADSVSISANMSSLVKGETLLDTARNIEAMRPDVVIIRHAYSGAAHFLAGRIKASVINAGDGTHAHPSQALLDMLTVRRHKGGLAGLKIAIVGDIAHSRVARSNSEGFTKMGAQVVLAGPPTMMPKGIETLGVQVAPSVEAAVRRRRCDHDAAHSKGAPEGVHHGHRTRVCAPFWFEPGARGVGQKRRDHYASRPDQPRCGNRLRSCRRALFADSGPGHQRRGGAHGPFVPGAGRRPQCRY